MFMRIVFAAVAFAARRLITPRRSVIAACLVATITPLTAMDRSQAAEIDVTGEWSQRGAYRIRTLDEHHAIGIAESTGKFSLSGREVKIDNLATDCYWLAEFSSWTDIRCVVVEDKENFFLFSVLMKIDPKRISLGTAEIVSGTGKFADLRGKFSVTWDFSNNAEKVEFDGASVKLEGRVTLGTGQ